VFNDAVLNSDTASQLVAYALKQHPEHALAFLSESGIKAYDGEDIETVLTVAI
jgi:hypothetical protein